jgi:hypothetical protein
MVAAHMKRVHGIPDHEVESSANQLVRIIELARRGELNTKVSFIEDQSFQITVQQAVDDLALWGFLGEH